MPAVYVHDDIVEVERLHRPLLDRFPGRLTVLEFLDGQARTLHEQFGRGNPAVCFQLRNWLPRCVGKPCPEVLNSSLTADEARLAVAREHGFADWAAVHREGQGRFEPAFERAVDAVVHGDIETLRRLLREDPGLATAVSPFGHRATLLHYIAANGVETWRQRTPANAADVARLLIDVGADPAATAQMYGGRPDTLALLLSSAHPAAAGCTPAIAAVLHAALSRD